MVETKMVKTKINEKYVDQEGILRIKVIDGVHIDLEALKEDASVNMELTGNQKALALYDSRAFFTMDKEARDYLKSGILDPTRIATAVLTNNLAVRILVNFIITFNPPKTPMKMFHEEKEALDWLRKVKGKSIV